MLERRCVEVYGTALGITGACHQPRMLKDLNVFGNGLLGNGEWFSELIDGGVSPGKPGNNGPPDRIRQRHEGPVQGVRA